MNKDLTTGKPASVLLRFTLPMLLSVAFQQLYNIADSVIAGKFAGEDALAAVGASYPVTMIFMAVAFGMNIGISVVISQLFGAKDFKEMKTAAYTGFISVAVVGVVLTVVGTVLCVASVGLYAYPISRADFRWRRVFTFISFFTQLFTAGTVAFYVTCRQILHIGNSIWALFLPLSFSAYWVLVMRSFYKSNVPDAVIESARIDGAGEWRTLIQIVLPLAVPGLATVALFAAISIWNNFFNCMLLVDEAKYYNLQYTIYQTLNNIRFLREMASQVGALASMVANLPSETFRMAMAMVTMGPIILAYPFFQKYFVKGLTIGAVKG